MVVLRLFKLSQECRPIFVVSTGVQISLILISKQVSLHCAADNNIDEDLPVFDIAWPNNGSVSGSEHVNKLERLAALFLLLLKEQYQLLQRALDFAVGQAQQIVSYAVEDIQSIVEARLQASDVQVPDLSDCFRIPDPFISLQNEYMQTKYYRENSDLFVSIMKLEGGAEENL